MMNSTGDGSRWFRRGVALLSKAAVVVAVVGTMLSVRPGPASRMSPQGARRAAPPNFVFILSDDQGWGDLGVYGHGRLRTPNLDALAAQGTLFTQFYVASPVCSPTRASFMSGRFPSELQIYKGLSRTPDNDISGQVDFLDPSLPSLTSMLHQAGYATAHYGKWHLGLTTASPDPGAYGIDSHATYQSTGPRLPGVLGRDPYFATKASETAVDEACGFIEDHQAQPFYVAVWLALPHAELNPTDEQADVYRYLAPAHAPDRGANQVYYASVTDLDDQVGRIMQKLEDLGLADDTVVLFASDNGPENIWVREASHSGVGSVGPFRGRKRSLYEGGVRVPFIARWPGHIYAGRVSEAVVASTDFLPTISQLAGGLLQPQELSDLDGEDVSDILLGASRGRAKPLLWDWRFPGIGQVIDKSPALAIREGDWKLLMNPNGSRVELYDLSSDPREMNNLAVDAITSTNPSIAAVVDQLSSELLEWKATLPVGPTFPAAGKDNYPMPQPTPGSVAGR